MYPFTPFNLDALGAVSRELACAVFQVFPEFAEHATMHQAHEEDGLSLYIYIPSPTGLEERALSLIIEEPESGEITLDFGPCHVHPFMFGDDLSVLVEWLAAILDDEVLVAVEWGPEGGWCGEWIDMRDADQLEDYLTHPFNTGRAELISWSGKADRVVTTDTY